MFWRRENKVLAMVNDYLTKAEECIRQYQVSFDCYFEQGLCGEFDEHVDTTHLAESFCDDLRRKAEEAMYEQSLIPESRSDIMELLEVTDKVPNCSEAVLHMIQSEFLKVPEFLKEDLRHLVHANAEICFILFESIRLLMVDSGKVRPIIDDIDKRESLIDRLEMEIIKKIFSNDDIEGYKKILLRDLVRKIGHLSDQCENVGEHMIIITAKRLV